jgi:small subunit ribosomal protein S29
VAREFDVDLNVYGKCDITGVHDDEAEPCPRVWDEVRKTWTDEWKNALYDNEVKALQARYDTMDYRLSDKLEAPQKLIDIINYGIENPDAATNAFAEVLHQLYKTDKYQTMMCVDGINAWFQPSQYPSFRYANYPLLKDQIPPHDLALVRLLMKFDGHFMRNGVKMMATSHYRMFNHFVEPEEIGHYPGYNARVPNLCLNDFRHAMLYYTYSSLYPNAYGTEWKMEANFVESQGNLGFLHDTLQRRNPVFK